MAGTTETHTSLLLNLTDQPPTNNNHIVHPAPPDTTLSPDNRFLVYTTIAPVAYMVHVGGPLDLVGDGRRVTGDG